LPSAEAAETSAGDVAKTGRKRRFSNLRVDTSEGMGRMAQRCLRALYDDLLAGVTDLTATERLDIERAALAEARLRWLQERELAGVGDPTDVTAATHLARKERRVVERIAKLAARRGRR
jgi:hypothetical protein